MTEAQTLLRAAPKQDPKPLSPFPVLPQIFRVSRWCVSSTEAMENGHIVWKTMLWIARSSGTAGMAVGKGPENLVQGARETFWQT